MITCAECVSRCFPDDPRVRKGRYHQSICQNCDKPDYYRELETKVPPEVETTVRHVTVFDLAGKKKPKNEPF